ncbi:transcriptional regulator [Clostridium botulinum]|uniref:Transcriptional regulator n=1 Tax=Clostridium botulinum TaxID=1491 RepID=A0AAU8Z3S6_CLOBO|nr:transcriptional regulator [Clostridium botulinum]MBA4507910.1 helix-turn-helix transcriptional regulator [Clostridium sporogenes]MBO0555319.1 XRE family transcriptional regulator [Clostridium botulinum]NFQ01038.1 helix-turn-helix transcriptional regulator [Clostridium sporogenes]NFQ34684.1 helix-turn-helix transcriptional regulator [Clostridium sporogenes]
MGATLKKLRKDSKLTQKALADKCNMSRGYLADLEADRYNPSIDTLKTIANALGVSVNEFFDEEDHSSEENIKLNKKDEKDIKKALSETLDQLENSQDGLMFDGEPIDDETRELLRISLENSMRLAKEIAKKKYTPKKYKK